MNNLIFYKGGTISDQKIFSMTMWKNNLLLERPKISVALVYIVFIRTKQNFPSSNQYRARWTQNLMSVEGQTYVQFVFNIIQDVVKLFLSKLINTAPWDFTPIAGFSLYSMDVLIFIYAGAHRCLSYRRT